MNNFIKVVGFCMIAFLFFSCSSDDSTSTVNEPFTGDVVLQTQNEVDEFGANNYEGINGTLRITFESTSASSTITDLGPLSSLTFITGDLDITNNGELKTLKGLENVTSVGNSLFIGSNDALLNIDAIVNLSKIDKDILVYGNKNLTNIDGFLGLTHVKGDLIIGSDQAPSELSNEKLTSIEGLANITNVGGDMLIAGNLIQNLSGLEQLTSVHGFLKISFNTQMAQLTGIENLTNIGGSLELRNNYSLLDLDSLSSLINIGGTLEISNNISLNDISGLYNLEKTSSLIVENNRSLIALGDAFPSLKNCTLIDFSNSFFAEFEGFNNLTEAQFIIVEGNENLENINGFNSIANLNTLQFKQLENLKSLSGFQSLTTVTDFTIEQPETITDGAFTVDAFDNLTNVLNNLAVTGTANTNLDFLLNLETVENDVFIENNENLNDLCGLTNLIQNAGLGGDFNVFHNLYNPTQQDILSGNCSL